jgi:hypothetical protein
MSVQAMTAVLGLPADLVSAHDRFVLLSIANHANREGERANPSRDTISAETGLSLSTVSRCTQRLRNAGLLEVLEWPGRNRDGKYSGSIVYAVRIPGLKKTDGPASSFLGGPGSGPSMGQTDTRTGTQPDTRTMGHDDTRTVSQTVSQTEGHGDSVTVEPWNREGTGPIRRCGKCDRPLSIEKTDGVRMLTCVYCSTAEADQIEMTL